jgi:Asp-tRNA(Asn)/Glu-tRNA(Gln) amidotransferase A subunit family amidase
MSRRTLQLAAIAFIMCGVVGQAQSAKPAAAPFRVVEASVADVHAAFARGTLTARALTQQYLDRIDAYDKRGPLLNSIITINPHALEDADRLDAQFKRTGRVGPLHGIPILVKDEIDTAGMPTTLGTLVFKDYRPPKDAFVVDRLRRAGAIILGKTTLSEFAAGDTYGSMFGSTRNPYDPTRTAGGSSGGSGAALAANLSMLALGEETAASIRRPGGWNALVTLRPTPGLVSRTGMWDGYPTTPAQVGPMARTVTDLARLLDVMVGYDPEDPLTALGVNVKHVPYSKYLDRNGLKGARIGVLREVLGNATDPASAEFKAVDVVFERNLAELKAAGATVVDPLVIPDLKKLMAVRATHPELAEEAMQLYLGRTPDWPFRTREAIGKHPDMDKAIPPTKATQWRALQPKTDWAQWGQYLRAREQLTINIAKVTADNRLDAIVHKTVEIPPITLAEALTPPYKTGNNYISTLNTFLVFAATMTVPSGYSEGGLPTGLTFFGPAYTEPTLLKLAYAYEQATHHRTPPKTAPPLARSPGTK